LLRESAAHGNLGAVALFLLAGDHHLIALGGERDEIGRLLARGVGGLSEESDDVGGREILGGLRRLGIGPVRSELGEAERREDACLALGEADLGRGAFHGRLKRDLARSDGGIRSADSIAHSRLERVDRCLAIGHEMGRLAGEDEGRVGGCRAREGHQVRGGQVDLGPGPTVVLELDPGDREDDGLGRRGAAGDLRGCGVRRVQRESDGERLGRAVLVDSLDGDGVARGELRARRVKPMILVGRAGADCRLCGGLGGPSGGAHRPELLGARPVPGGLLVRHLVVEGALFVRDVGAQDQALDLAAPGLDRAVERVHCRRQILHGLEQGVVLEDAPYLVDDVERAPELDERVVHVREDLEQALLEEAYLLLVVVLLKAIRVDHLVGIEPREIGAEAVDQLALGELAVVALDEGLCQLVCLSVGLFQGVRADVADPVEDVVRGDLLGLVDVPLGLSKEALPRDVGDALEAAAQLGDLLFFLGALQHQRVLAEGSERVTHAVGRRVEGEVLFLEEERRPELRLAWLVLLPLAAEEVEEAVLHLLDAVVEVQGVVGIRLHRVAVIQRVRGAVPGAAGHEERPVGAHRGVVRRREVHRVLGRLEPVQSLRDEAALGLDVRHLRDVDEEVTVRLDGDARVAEFGALEVATLPVTEVDARERLRDVERVPLLDVDRRHLPMFSWDVAQPPSSISTRTPDHVRIRWRV
jgi:hypothetical protein